MTTLIYLFNIAVKSKNIFYINEFGNLLFKEYNNKRISKIDEIENLIESEEIDNIYTNHFENFYENYQIWYLQKKI